MNQVTGVKVFTETMAKQRDQLGERITRWLTSMRGKSDSFELLEMIVRQSSDNEFHCLSVVCLYAD